MQFYKNLGSRLSRKFKTRLSRNEQGGPSVVPLLSSVPLCSRSCSSPEGVSARMLSCRWVMSCWVSDCSTEDWHTMVSGTSEPEGVHESVSGDGLLSPFGELRKLGSCFRVWPSQSLALCRSSLSLKVSLLLFAG